MFAAIVGRDYHRKKGRFYSCSKEAVEKALVKHRAGEGAKLGRRTDIERELSLIAAKKEHLVDSIAPGDKDPAIFARLRVEETRRKDLVRELEALRTIDQAISLDDPRSTQTGTESSTGGYKDSPQAPHCWITAIASDLVRASVAV